MYVQADSVIGKENDVPQASTSSRQPDSQHVSTQSADDNGVSSLSQSTSENSEKCSEGSEASTSNGNGSSSGEFRCTCTVCTVIMCILVHVVLRINFVCRA